MYLPKTIRLDDTDLQVFDRAAEPGEWAVSGAFAFDDLHEDALVGKIRQAFVTGLMGTASFGWSSLVFVAEASEADYESAVNALADHFVASYGAANREAALPRARDEVNFAAGLCEHPANTLLAVRRDLGADGIVERFRIVSPPAEMVHTKIREMVED